MSLPPQLQDKIATLQRLQQNLETLMLQRQQLEIELRSTESALPALEDYPKESPVFRIVGRIMVKVDVEKIKEELGDRREVLKLRINSISKQESKIREKIEAIQNEIRGKA